MLETPDNGDIRATALFAHCFTNDSGAAPYIARALTGGGFAVLQVDFAGLKKLTDLRLAANYLRQKHAPPRLLVGHGLGGSALLAMAAEMPDAQAVVAIAASAQPASLKKLFDDTTADAATLHDRVRRLGNPLLIFHSPADTVAPIDNARQLYEAAPQPKSFISLERADHLLSNKDDAIYVADTLAAWARRFLPASNAVTDAGTVVVTGAGTHFTQRIDNGKHRLLADEPEMLGGDDRGPTPDALLMAALGACSAITMQMYAKRKQLPLAGVTVSLSRRDDKTGVIYRDIHISGDLSDEQRARLLQIAEKCPVHKSLSLPTTIKTTLKE